MGEKILIMHTLYLIVVHKKTAVPEGAAVLNLASANIRS